MGFCWLFIAVPIFTVNRFLLPQHNENLYKVLRATFDCFDRDGDGAISLMELSSGHLLGTLSMEELHEILTWCDEDGDTWQKNIYFVSFDNGLAKIDSRR